jgi:hypothetical protein
MNYYGCSLHAFRYANTGHLKVKVTVYYSTIGDCKSAGNTSWWPYFNLVKKTQSLANWTTHMHYNAICGWLFSVPKEGQVNFQAVMDVVQGMQSPTTLPASINDPLAHLTDCSIMAQMCI